MLIAKGNLTRQALEGQVVVVTGAGNGIGFEAARALLWLGARVILAEIDREAGRAAEARLQTEFGRGLARFLHTDVGDERSVRRMASQARRQFGRVDMLINNATIAPLGAVVDLPVQAWDRSYRVNLRGPVLLAQAFLPEMVARGSGAFACVSSTGQAFMGAYELFKAAQVGLAATLDAELQDSPGVSAFTIGPGVVPTDTLNAALPRLAALMGKTTGELQELLKGHALTVEAAGAGFAAALAMADRYKGQEISSLQALMDAGINLSQDEQRLANTLALSAEEIAQAAGLIERVHTTLREQSAGWRERSVFEQQWMFRTFSTRAGMPVETWLERLARMESAAQRGDLAGLSAVVDEMKSRAPLRGLGNFYAHLYDLAKGYLKDPAQRERELAIVRGWQEDVEALAALLERG